MMLGEVAAMAYLKLAAALIFAAGLMIYPAECAAAVREARLVLLYSQTVIMLMKILCRTRNLMT